MRISLLLLSILMTVVAFETVSAAVLDVKYTFLFSNPTYVQPHPVVADIDKDGVNEIVFNGGKYIYALDGNTGRVKWRQGENMERAPELVDLNNDGTPEVLYVIWGPRLRAVNGKGEILWTSKTLGGWQLPQWPILAYDVDGTGYPYIYVATEDTDPSPFSGNLDDYDGALTMLDHKGNILRSTWLSHPCWGGMALADPNFDGRFIIYVGDRRAGGDGNWHSKGLVAFDAKTLQMLWSKSDIQHSSPLPILADVQGDRNLEMVATSIVGYGPLVMNARTGQVYKDYQSKRLPTHATPTVYDFDGDGNLEVIYSTSYPTGTTLKDLVVFDLVTGVIDWKTRYSYYVAWPPKVGDVTGNGVMEMLVATGNQDQKGNFPLLIYDNKYRLIEQRNITNAGQLTPVVLADVDKDGLQELIVIGVNGKLLVYNSRARVPNPAPRADVHFYSEYRQGAAEYVAPPGPHRPKVLQPSPSNNAQGVATGVTLSARIHDYQKDRMSGRIELYLNGNWQTLATFSNRGNGQVSASTGSRLRAATTYRWRVIVNDGKGNWRTQEYTFRTR
jgi:outer membrane protein assembly factor BamB